MNSISGPSVIPGKTGTFNPIVRQGDGANRDVSAHGALLVARLKISKTCGLHHGIRAVHTASPKFQLARAKHAAIRYELCELKRSLNKS
jgi:hypothetical protein